MAHYAIVDGETGEVVRVVSVLPSHLPPALRCVALPDARGFAGPLPEPRVRAPRLPSNAPTRVPNRALDSTAMRAAVRRALATACGGPASSLLVFRPKATSAGIPEPAVRAALHMIQTSVSADDQTGRLADDVIGVLLRGGGMQSARAICTRIERMLARLPVAWSARCLSCAGDRDEIETWCRDPG